MQGSSRASLALLRARLDELAGAGAAADAVPGVVSRTVSRLRGEQSSLTAASEQLFEMADLLTTEVALRRALADPGVPEEARRGLLERLLGEQLEELPLQLLRTAVSARWSRPADLLAAVEDVGAEALLAAEQAAGGLDEVEDELFRFARLVDRTPRLSLALSDRGLPMERKAALLERLLGGRVRPATMRLVERVVSRPRGRGVGREIEALADLASQRRQRSIAVVTVARPIDEEQADRLRVAIARAFGTEVVLEIVIDPTVLGGVSVRVDDEVVDGTVLRRLAEAKRQLRR
ncbi:MAG: synthase delta subunit [Mycobacterium sp.]|nr:synthase delta subunit [Mycobacterium sp.]